MGYLYPRNRAVRTLPQRAPKVRARMGYHPHKLVARSSLHFLPYIERGSEGSGMVRPAFECENKPALDVWPECRDGRSGTLRTQRLRRLGPLRPSVRRLQVQ